MQIFNLEQLSPEWFQIRQKRLTASHAQCIAAQGAGLRSYVNELMAESYSTAPKEHFSNHHIERGISLEPQAGMVYSFEKNIATEKVGFVTLGSYVGCSPDLFAGKDGLCEIKCHADKKHFDLILGGKFESKYIWQVQCQMLICEKKWADLVSYNPNFTQYLIVHRILPDQEKFDKLSEGMLLGKRMIEEIEQKMS